tara:strand:+ start:1607 stop:1942 length:336 start_codon:yes stop_codon:yes gene_type:complete
MRIALNKCYGGFALTEEVAKRIRSLGIARINPEIDVWPCNRDFGYEEHDNPYWYRRDPYLIKVLEMPDLTVHERLHSEIELIFIPKRIQLAGWYIDDYDGLETIHENHWTA